MNKLAGGILFFLAVATVAQPAFSAREGDLLEQVRVKMGEAAGRLSGIDYRGSFRISGPRAVQGAFHRMHQGGNSWYEMTADRELIWNGQPTVRHEVAYAVMNNQYYAEWASDGTSNVVAAMTVWDHTASRRPDLQESAHYAMLREFCPIGLALGNYHYGIGGLTLKEMLELPEGRWHWKAAQDQQYIVVQMLDPRANDFLRMKFFVNPTKGYMCGRIELYGEEGTSETYHIELQEVEQGIWFPMSIRTCMSPTSPSDRPIEFTATEVHVNLKIPRNAFTITALNYPQKALDDIGIAHILADGTTRNDTLVDGELISKQVAKTK